MADPNIAMSRTESPATQSFHTVSMVKDYVRSRRQSTREAFVPLHHPPGHAQVDFGEAVVEVGGRREKVAFFCLKGFSLCFRSHQMLIVLLRSRHGFRTVPGDVRELLDLGK